MATEALVLQMKMGLVPDCLIEEETIFHMDQGQEETDGMKGITE